MEARIGIDKIAVVMKVESTKDQIRIKNWIWQQQDQGNGTWAGSYSIPQYRMNLQININQDGYNGQGALLLISADPYLSANEATHMPYLRIQWNPSYNGIKGQARIREVADQIIPGGYSSLFYFGKITAFNVFLEIVDGLLLNMGVEISSQQPKLDSSDGHLMAFF